MHGGIVHLWRKLPTAILRAIVKASGGHKGGCQAGIVAYEEHGHQDANRSRTCLAMPATVEIRMSRDVRILLLAALLIATAPARADWKPVEKIETYTVSGSSGAELYASIGARGPQAALGTRAIALTNFKLTWQRDYQPRGGGCTLVSAKPKLIITYTLPEPSTRLAAPVKAAWETFIEGVRKHERVHGADIEDMVRQIEATSIGLRAPEDPRCKKVRAELQKRLAVLSAAQRKKSRDFDRVELGAGGAVHTLILDLVNSR